jgi:hypothetical protein
MRGYLFFKTVSRREAAVEPTWMYLRRVLKNRYPLIVIQPISKALNLRRNNRCLRVRLCVLAAVTQYMIA